MFKHFYEKPRNIILVSLVLYILSLTQAAFTANDFDGVETVDSLTCLLVGSTAILGGGLLEWLVWLANPLYFFSLLLLARKNKTAKQTSLIAAGLAAWF